MKLHLPKLLRSALLAVIGMSTITLSCAEESTPSPSQTPATLVDGGVWDGEDVNYSWNSASTTGRKQGVALYLYGKTLTITNGSVYFDNNSYTPSGTNGYVEGTAVNVNGEMILNNNSIVSFSQNQMSGDTKKTVSGGALYVHGNTFITENDTVAFSKNSIDTGNTYGVKAYGGAVYVAGSYSEFKISDNTTVDCSGNSITTKSSNSSGYHRGAFLYASGNNHVEFSGNTERLSITGNYVEGKVGINGGAIYVDIDDSLKTEIVPQFSITGNGKVEISDNYADSLNAYSVTGGAIHVAGTSAKPHTPVFQISGNTSVEVLNNAARGSSAKGGALYVDSLELRIQGNGSVLFEGNYEKSRDVYCMRGIYMVSNVGAHTQAAEYSSDTALTLSAGEGESIEMRDGIYLAVDTSVKFNADYGDAAQTGDIIFTGEYTEANLNKVIAANTAAGETARTATEEEIANSRTFAFQHDLSRSNVGQSNSQIPKLKDGVLATLEGGRLIVEEGAHYVGMGFEAVGGSESTLRLKNADFEHHFTRAGSYPCTFYYDVTFGDTTTLEAEGVNTMTAGNLTMKDGSAMTYVVGSENKTEAVLSYIGGSQTTVSRVDENGKEVWTVTDAESTLTQEGALTIWVKDAEELKTGQRYALLTTSDNVTLTWDAANITVKGVAKASDLAWDGNTLYLTYNRGALNVATWVNEEGNNKWDGESQNWTEDGYLYSDTEVATKVLFDDTAEGGEVELVGTHTPEHVEVNNSANNDYSFIGEGSLDGDMMLVKNGEGSLLIDTENSYDGGTEVNGGELAVGNDKALGEGKVSLKDNGTLNLGSQAVTNDIEAAGGVLRGADQYLGNLVVSEDLTIEGNATAKSITMLKNAGIVLQSAALYSIRTTPAAVVVSTDAMYVRTERDGNFSGSLTLNEGGLIELNNGNSLVVTGTLTLGEGTTLMLNGNYAAGDMLVSATESLTMGAVTLDYDDTTVELERIGNSLVLVSKFKQDKADIAAQGNWGIATASRAFVNTVRGQHSLTGCIANGRGTVWAAVLGAYNDMDGADISVQGAAVGVDAKVGSCSTVGIALGYTDGEVQPAGMRDVDQEGNYVALYGEHGLKKLRNNSCLSLDWVAAYGQTESKAAGMTWEQDSLQLNTRLNWNRKVTDRLSMSVFGGLEYFATESDTSQGVKSGSIQNLRGEIGVGARYVAWGTPAATDAKSGLVRPGCEKLVLNGELRYFNDLVRSNPVIEMEGLRGGGDNPGRQGVGLEAGATYRIGERWSASANYSFNAMEDSTEHRVNVGASYTF